MRRNHRCTGRPLVDPRTQRCLRCIYAKAVASTAYVPILGHAHSPRSRGLRQWRGIHVVTALCRAQRVVARLQCTHPLPVRVKLEAWPDGSGNETASMHRHHPVPGMLRTLVCGYPTASSMHQERRRMYLAPLCREWWLRTRHTRLPCRCLPHSPYQQHMLHRVTRCGCGVHWMWHGRSHVVCLCRRNCVGQLAERTRDPCRALWRTNHHHRDVQRRRHEAHRGMWMPLLQRCLAYPPVANNTRHSPRLSRWVPQLRSYYVARVSTRHLRAWRRAHVDAVLSTRQDRGQRLMDVVGLRLVG